MSTLHTVNKSPFEKSTFESCLRRARPGDAVLLIEDGVYAAVKGTGPAERIAAQSNNLSFYVLGPDLAARGLATGSLTEGIEVVDCGGFVAPVTEHEVAHAWL